MLACEELKQFYDKNRLISGGADFSFENLQKNLKRFIIVLVCYSRINKKKI